MEEFETSNSKEDIVSRLPKDNYLVTKNSLENFDLSTVLPETLNKALRIYGIDLEMDHILENGYKACSWKKFCLKIKLLLAHLPLLLITVTYFMGYQHVTFIVSGTLDSLCYLGSLYIFLYRKKYVIQCLQDISAMPYNTHREIKKKKFQKTTLLLAAVFIYAIIYLTCDLLFIFLQLAEPSKIKKNLNAKYLELFANATYSFVICIGIPIHLVLFVQFASLISDRLQFVEQELESFENECFSQDAICKQRQVFSKLQNISSMSDSIFKEITFLWLMKIIIRGCLSAVDIFSRSWTNAESYTQIIVIFDAIFDLFHLLTLCIYAGKIDYAKMKLLQALIYMGSRYELKNQSRNEMHLFISMVGHSQLGFTVADMFFLNKSTALTILGALGSYCVLIYQFTSN